MRSPAPPPPGVRAPPPSGLTRAPSQSPAGRPMGRSVPPVAVPGAPGGVGGPAAPGRAQAIGRAVPPPGRGMPLSLDETRSSTTGSGESPAVRPGGTSGATGIGRALFRYMLANNSIFLDVILLRRSRKLRIFY